MGAEKAPPRRLKKQECLPRVKFFYSAFGLCLSASLPLPGLLRLRDSCAQCLQVSLNGLPPWLEDLPATDQTIWHVSPYRNERGETSLKIWKLRGGAYFRFIYDDGTQFVVEHPGTGVWATWPECMA